MTSVKKRAYDTAWRAAHREESQAYITAYRANDPARSRLQGIRRSAKCHGLDFNLTLEDMQVPTVCPVLGIQLKQGGPWKPNCPSLDRIDNLKGYIKGNVIWVSLRANALKKDATIEELKLLYEGYKQIMENAT